MSCLGVFMIRVTMRRVVCLGGGGGGGNAGVMPYESGTGGSGIDENIIAF